MQADEIVARLVEVTGAESVEALEMHVRELVRERDRLERRVAALEAAARQIVMLAGGRP